MWWRPGYKAKFMKKKAILVFDIGKTNKKYFLLDESYSELEHNQVQIPESIDDDGFPCDDLSAIKNWIINIVSLMRSDGRYELTHINFSAYGATLVHMDREGEPCTPMYNYQKDFPETARSRFEEMYGNLEEWSKATSSPYLGMLNAGLQLFWLKYEKPFFFQQIRRSVFLPQYLSYLLTGVLSMEFTGIGCHTGMWNFEKNDFHDWIYREDLHMLFPPIVSTFSRHKIRGAGTLVGVGIHDSSSSLVPYRQSNSEPFILISTGTWSICLNPFNYEPLTLKELKADCLCYLQPEGIPVKASRFFLGNIFARYEQQISAYFGRQSGFYHSLDFSDSLYDKVSATGENFFGGPGHTQLSNSGSSIVNLSSFENYETAYHQLMHELAEQQVQKIKLVSGLNGPGKIYVDGGFASNIVFLRMLEKKLPGCSITASALTQGSSLGAAMVVSQELGTVD